MNIESADSRNKARLRGMQEKRKSRRNREFPKQSQILPWGVISI